MAITREAKRVLVLSNMVNVFLIVYVLGNLESLGALGALLIMLTSSGITLLLSYGILGKDKTLAGTDEKGTPWKTYLLLAAVLVGIIGFVINNTVVIVLGFLFLIPVLLPSVFKALKIKI